MDRRNRWMMGSLGLGLALMVAGSGCRSPRSEVPPRPSLGAPPPPGVTFSSEPNPNPAGAFGGGQSGGLGPQTGAYSQFPPSYSSGAGGATTPGAATGGGGFSTGGVEPTSAAPPTGGGYGGPDGAGASRPAPNMVGAGTSPM